MVSHGNIIFTAAIVQIRFTEAPVTTTTDKATAIYKEAQDMIILIECHLADTDFEVFRIRNLTIHFKGEVGIVEVRCAVTFRPPQARVFHLQLWEVLDIENDCLLFSRR